MKRLYFIRHGESVNNSLGLGAGRTETPLTDKGRRQAKLAGEHATQYKIDYIISSSLSRAHETAEIIAKEIGYSPKNIEINDLFIERNYGILEGTPMASNVGIDFDKVSGIEKTSSLIKRARKALDYLESLPEENILVVSHGAFGRALRHHLLEDFPFDNIHRLENAKIVQWL